MLGSGAQPLYHNPAHDNGYTHLQTYHDIRIRDYHSSMGQWHSRKGNAKKAIDYSLQQSATNARPWTWAATKGWDSADGPSNLTSYPVRILCPHSTQRTVRQMAAGANRGYVQDQHWAQPPVVAKVHRQIRWQGPHHNMCPNLD